jgi:hypothetical protein
MPPKRNAADKAAENVVADVEENVQHEDETRELLQWMKQQMTDLVAKNDATNAKLELLSIKYQDIQGNVTPEAIASTPRSAEEPAEAIRSATIPRGNNTAAS